METTKREFERFERKYKGKRVRVLKPESPFYGMVGRVDRVETSLAGVGVVVVRGNEAVYLFSEHDFEIVKRVRIKKQAVWYRQERNTALSGR